MSLPQAFHNECNALSQNLTSEDWLFLHSQLLYHGGFDSTRRPRFHRTFAEVLLGWQHLAENSLSSSHLGSSEVSSHKSPMKLFHLPGAHQVRIVNQSESHILES